MENCKNSKKYFGIILVCILNNCSVNGMDLVKRTCAILISMANPVRLLQNQWTYGSYNKAWELMISCINHQAKSLEAQPLSHSITELDADEKQLDQLARRLDLDLTKVGLTFSEGEDLGNTQFYGHTGKQPQILIPKSPFLSVLNRKERTILLGQNIVSIKDKALLKIASLACIIPYVINNLVPIITSKYISQDSTIMSHANQEITFATIPLAVCILRYVEYYYQKRADTITARELGAAQESIETLEHVQDIADQNYAQSSLFKKLYTALCNVLRTAPTLAERIAYLQPLAVQQALEGSS